MVKTNKSPILYTRLVGEVNDNSVKEVMKAIDEANNKHAIKEIQFSLASHGGFLYPAFALYDHIQASKKPVDIIASGYCMSAAVMILQAGRRRISRPHTSFMVHPSSYRLEERKPYEEFLSMVEEYKRNHDLFVRLSIRRSGARKSDFEKLYQPRKYFTPQEALKFGRHGLIDKIERK